jgi:hypothetical protein
MSTQETKTKISLEETMKQIELEAEAKVIQGYKTGKIEIPKLAAADGVLVLESNKNADEQIDILKNIMAEGATKFEAAAGRQMSYSEMRQMFG